MDGYQAGWQDRTFVVRIDPTSVYPLFGGYATRVSVVGDLTLDSLYVGPVSARDPWIAAILYQLTFNGGNKTITLMRDDAGDFIIATTDGLPLGIDGSRGLLVSGYIDPTGNGIVSTQSTQLGWQSRYIAGDHAAEVDKRTGYVDSSQQYNSIAVQLIAGDYTAPTPGGL